MIRIMFLIRSLERAGAERQLVELVKQIDYQQFEIAVATFYEQGVLSAEIKNIKGIKLIGLGKKGRWDVFGFLQRLNTEVRIFRPHILHGYLDVGNILAWIIGRLNGAKVIFGVRASNMDFSRYDWTVRLVYQLVALSAWFSDKIIVNSNVGLEYHKKQGFPSHKMTIIHNGIDTQKFKPDSMLREKTRKMLGVQTNDILIGTIGRLDPMKDHQTFLRAAAIVSKIHASTKFVCIGRTSEPYFSQIQSLAHELDLETNLQWVEEQQDIQDFYNALDIFVSSSSYGEGFSNVIGEAMASGTPCIVTDVGDSSLIIGQTGKSVPPQNLSLLAEAIIKLVQSSHETRKELGLKARRRIIEKFSLNKMVANTQEVFIKVMNEH